MNTLDGSSRAALELALLELRRRLDAFGALASEVARLHSRRTNPFPTWVLYKLRAIGCFSIFGRVSIDVKYRARDDAQARLPHTRVALCG